jgi:hypothetical protein
VTNRTQTRHGPKGAPDVVRTVTAVLNVRWLEISNASPSQRSVRRRCVSCKQTQVCGKGSRHQPEAVATALTGRWLTMLSMRTTTFSS